MNITNENKVRIYRNEKEGRIFYSVGLTKKKQDGTYENGFMNCQFRKDVEVEDKTDIYIKNAWLTFYKQDKKTNPYIFINDFSLVENKVEELKEETKDKLKTDPFEDMGKQVRMDDFPITDEDLPF